MILKHTAMLLLLILLLLVVGMAQERDRILWWFQGLPWWKQLSLGVSTVLFFTVSIAFLIIHK